MKVKALICEITWRPFYRGEEVTPVLYSDDTTNFINFNQTYYGYFDGAHLEDDLEEHHILVDYVIFVAKDPQQVSRIVGWYKQATLYRNQQYFDVDKPFYVSAKDEQVVLLAQEDRSYILDIQGPYQWVNIDRRLNNFLKKTKRINYIASDFNRSVTMPLKSLETTCEFIEKEMADMNYLQALLVCNRALVTYGRLASLIYYKAWILYSFLQYRQASQLLFAIKDIETFHDFACYMLGNIYFETGEYETSIQMFLENRHLNKDQNAYMLSQAYAMNCQVSQALAAIDQALMLNPKEEVYQAYAKALREWGHV